MTRLLVSVRDEAEARAAAWAGADFIDAKDPAEGALGALAPARIAAIVRMLRAQAPALRVSATIGDVDAACVDEILARVAAVAGCGVDFVKVGVAGDDRAPAAAAALLHALAACRAPVVPVLLADAGIDPALVAAAVRTQAFPALMLDTADKGAGSLVQRMPHAALAAFVAQVRASGRLAGLAGSLRLEDAPALRALAPDFAGFRGAVCAEGRAGALDAGRVSALARGLAGGVGQEELLRAEA